MTIDKRGGLEPWSTSAQLHTLAERDIVIEGVHMARRTLQACGAGVSRAAPDAGGSRVRPAGAPLDICLGPEDHQQQHVACVSRLPTEWNLQRNMPSNTRVLCSCHGGPRVRVLSVGGWARSSRPSRFPQRQRNNRAEAQRAVTRPALRAVSRLCHRNPRAPPGPTSSTRHNNNPSPPPPVTNNETDESSVAAACSCGGVRCPSYCNCTMLLHSAAA